MRTLPLVLLVAAAPALAGEKPWRADGTVGGMKVELREVEGSKFDEVRVTTTSTVGLQKLCDAIYAKNVGAKAEGNFKKRVVLRETETERWTYEQIAVPVVSDRDYVVHVRLVQPASSGRCEVDFQSEDDPAYPPAAGHVRLKSVRGHWLVLPVEGGGVSVAYTVFSDPGGAVPAFLAKGSQRNAAVDFMKTILARATAL
jgi:hypothetical protein